MQEDREARLWKEKKKGATRLLLLWEGEMEGENMKENDDEEQAKKAREQKLAEV